MIPENISFITITTPAIVPHGKSCQSNPSNPYPRSISRTHKEDRLHNVHARQSLDGDVDEYHGDAANLGEPPALLRLAHVQDGWWDEAPNDSLEKVLLSR